jgi:hypothetical protein
MAEPLITLSDIRVQYGAAAVLDVPALDIYDGEHSRSSVLTVQENLPCSE